MGKLGVHLRLSFFHWKIHRLGVSYASLGEDVQNETTLITLLMWSFSVSVIQQGLMLHLRFWDLHKGVYLWIIVGLPVRGTEARNYLFCHLDDIIPL